jgi:hypothetical protein
LALVVNAARWRLPVATVEVIVDRSRGGNGAVS